jgi:hypothetical protein
MARDSEQSTARVVFRFERGLGMRNLVFGGRFGGGAKPPSEC